MRLALLFSLIALGVTVEIPSSKSTNYSCEVIKYNGVFFEHNETSILVGRAAAKDLDDCMRQCISSYDCKAVNFVEKTSICYYLNTGISDPHNANAELYSRKDGSWHAYFICGDGPSWKPTNPVKCGSQAPQYQPNLKMISRRTVNHIIKGRPVNEHSWPWVVPISAVFRKWTGHICGSSLLRVRDHLEESDIVLTAAHCVTNRIGGHLEKLNADRLTLIAGQHSLNVYEVGEQEREGAEIRFHRQYRPSPDTFNDIALIKLDKPVKFTDTIRPICLPKQGAPIPIDKTCVALGWGRTSPDFFSKQQTAEVLQQLRVPVQSASICASAWGRDYPANEVYKEDQMICAGVTENVTASVCRGDSGGPLACQETDGTWTVYGVVSFTGHITCLGREPPVFARVSNYVDWITENMLEMTSL